MKHDGVPRTYVVGGGYGRGDIGHLLDKLLGRGTV